MATDPKEFKLTPALIYEATNGGLDIFAHYFTGGEYGLDVKNLKKNFRSQPKDIDPTASSHIYEYNGIYFIKRFNTGETIRPIDLVMTEERADFADALKIIAQRHQIVATDGTAYKKPAAKMSKREPAAGEEFDSMTWEETDFTMADLQKIFAKNVWDFMANKKRKGDNAILTPEEKQERAFYHAKAVCERFNFKKLAWYEKILRDKNDKNKKVAYKFESTDAFPIFMFDEGDWQKFYKPMETEKEYRFFAYGKKPEIYTFGKKQLFQKYLSLSGTDALDEEEDEDDEDDENKAPISSERKLQDAMAVSGGSDALNVAALGYNPIWANSEGDWKKVKNFPFWELKKYAHKVYQVPDLDETGFTTAFGLSNEYIDLHTVNLPRQIKGWRDSQRGGLCKDVKDYFGFFGEYDFKQLVKNAMPMRFWETSVARDAKTGKIKFQDGEKMYKYEPDNELIYNFLKINGYGRFKVSNEKEKLFVKVNANTVETVGPEDLRKFIKNFLRVKNFDRKLINTFHRSPQLSDSSLSQVDDVEITFSDCSSNHQVLCFKNINWHITKAEIKPVPLAKSEVFVWADEIIKHDVRLLPESFTIFENQAGELDVTFHNLDDMYLKYLICVSKVHWRKELEEELDKLGPKERIEYLAKYKYSLEGPLLSPEEQKEQKGHFINKVCCIGYTLHRYKRSSQAYMPWGMDYNMQNVGQSYGGTGKSAGWIGLLAHMMKHTTHNGSDPKIFDDKFIFGEVNEHTDLIYFDDAHPYFNLRYLFSMITGGMRSENKGLKAYSMTFENSPKVVVTSNFPPRDIDSATQRRLWFTLFSDYFHKSPNGEYRENRDMATEFGKDMYRDYTEEEWNQTLNTAAQMVKAWLTWGKVDPPGEGVMKNTYRNKMGATFKGWADNFFHTESGNLNVEIQKIMCFEQYRIDTSDAKLISQQWYDKLKLWCLYNGYTLNPKERCNTENGTLIKHKRQKMMYRNGSWEAVGEKVTVDYIFIAADVDAVSSNETVISPEGQKSVNPDLFTPNNDPNAPLQF